ncbi:uncharacterized protein LOC127762066 [Oryza glaberrima]|uniref:F-box associated domain-containing protein n=1 Tax=Oryza glaberrima TaxID=4538 RepID=I1NX61_ORYGL|nr:uncharacterized protein LOC127762066 [Oryza glaberrima]
MSVRRFVQLVLEEFAPRRSNYTLRNIDMDRFFLPRPSPVPSAAAAADAVEYGSLPCPAMTFYPPSSSLSGNQNMEFFLLGGNHNMVVAADQSCRTVLYDPGEHAVRTMPALPYQVTLPATSVTVGDDLYILDVDDGGSFHGLIYEDGLNEDWRCCALPPPALSDFEVDSYAVIGGTDIWLSTHGNGGIYCFDTVRHAWSTVATRWTLPFVGLAEYCHEHGLWFGLSHSTRDRRRRSLVLSALDLDGGELPLLRSFPMEFTPPDALNLVSSDLVNLGSGKFCIARFFRTDEDHRDGEELFAVLTAVEVERCDDDEDDAGGGANGGGLRMLKHRSEMYKLTSEMMYWVL